MNTEIQIRTRPKIRGEINRDGQMKPIRMVDMFKGKDYIADFILVYLKAAAKKLWLENSCFVAWWYQLVY